MISKLSMPLPQMVTIHDALSAVNNASEQDIARIIEVLDSEGFSCATESAEGLFQWLDVGPLPKLNAKQRTIVQAAQRPGW